MTGSTGSRIVSNDVYNNVIAGIDVEADSTGTSMANNIIVDNGLTLSSSKGNIYVDATSLTGTTLDYDMVFLHSAPPTQSTDHVGQREIHVACRLSWSPPAWRRTASKAIRCGSAATGNFHLQARSPAIDSANTAASGEPTADISGRSRLSTTGVRTSFHRAHDGYFRFNSGFRAIAVLLWWLPMRNWWKPSKGRCKKCWHRC